MEKVARDGESQEGRNEGGGGQPPGWAEVEAAGAYAFGGAGPYFNGRKREGGEEGEHEKDRPGAPVDGSQQSQ